METRLNTRAMLLTAATLMASAFFSTSFAQITSETSDPDTLSIETGGGSPITYDIEAIKKEFPVSERVTRTPWTKEGEVIQYRGVYLKDLLQRNNINTYSIVEVHADDGFLARVPKADIDNYSPMIAYEKSCTDADRKKGKCDAGDTFRQLDIDESGPFTVVWPYDDLPTSYIPSRNNLWVWWVISLRPVE